MGEKDKRGLLAALPLRLTFALLQRPTELGRLELEDLGLRQARPALVVELRAQHAPGKDEGSAVSTESACLTSESQ